MRENSSDIREKLFTLRARFLPFGWFSFLYNSDENVFICKYGFGNSKEKEFLNSSIEGVLDELALILMNYKQVYIPRYIQ